MGLGSGPLICTCIECLKGQDGYRLDGDRYNIRTALVMTTQDAHWTPGNVEITR